VRAKARSEDASSAPAPLPAAAARHGAAACALTPLGGARYQVRFTADQAWVDRLREAQALASHRIPDGDVTAILDEALELLCERLRKERFAEREPKASRPATPSAGVRTETEPGRAKGPDATVAGDSPGPEPAPATGGRERRSRHIPNDVKRAVASRDEGRCSFVAPDGRRCGEVRFLQFHHVDTWARGGGHTAQNVMLRCHAHNQLAARLDFGPDWMAAFGLQPDVTSVTTVAVR
jgi:hypothetical protein